MIGGQPYHLTTWDLEGSRTVQVTSITTDGTKAKTGSVFSIIGPIHIAPAAQRELDDNFFKLRLWQMPDLLKAIFRSYGNLSDETRAKLPLKQIWTTTSEGDA